MAESVEGGERLVDLAPFAYPWDSMALKSMLTKLPLIGAERRPETAGANKTGLFAEAADELREAALDRWTSADFSFRR